MGTPSVVAVQQVIGGDREIDNTEVDNAAASEGKAHRQRTEVHGARSTATPHITSSTLPAAGAFTSQSLAAIPEGHTRVTYVVTYTRGADGGFPLLRVKWGNGSDIFHSIVTVKQSVPVGAFARRTILLEELQGPAPVDGTPITFEIPMRVPTGATTCQLIAAEGGVVGTPGNIEISLMTGTE